MTTLAQRIKETPMAPYMALLRGMTREQKQIVVTFITESMEEPEGKRQVPAEFKKLRGMVNGLTRFLESCDLGAGHAVTRHLCAIVIFSNSGLIISN